MSNGQKAAWDDECDWEELKRVYRLKNNWKVYSIEADYAREYMDSCSSMNTIPITTYLNLYVKHKMEQRALKEKQANEITELLTYEKLKEKFE